MPVIRIVLKKSIAAEQIFMLNAQDFERAGLARKTGYKFLLKFREGKISNVIVDLPLASSLASVILADEAIKDILRKNEFHISLNPKFELSIKHIQQFDVEDKKKVKAEMEITE